jgi:hypothetical protein
VRRWWAHRLLRRTGRALPWPVKVAAVAISVLAVVAVAVAVSEQSSTPATPATTTVLGAVASGAPAPDVSERDARVWIGEYGGDAANVAANVSDVELAMGELRRSPTQANINQLGSMAQTASDGIRRSERIGSSAGGMLGVAERHVVLGGGLLEGALHAIVAYMDDPGRAALVRMTRRYDHAVAEWNSAVRTVWRVAHSSRPPTV